MCLSVSVYERQCTDDPPEKNLVFLWIYCAWRKCLRCGISDRADRESVDRCTDPADRGAASWNLIVSQKNRKSASGSFCKHTFDSSIEVGIFLGNYLLAQGAFENLVWYGNVTMLFKMFFMIPVTSAAVMWRKRQQETEMGNLQILLLLLLPLFSVLFLYSLIEMGRIYMDLYGVRLMVVNLAALVLLNFCFLYLFGYWFRSHKLEGQLAEFQMQNELQYRYYAELEQKYRESRKIIHDMKNHLQAVEHLYQAKDGQEQGGAYVKDLYHMLNLLGEKYYSSNRMLNIICNDKLSLARHPAVAISVEIGDVDFSDLRDIDITTIFANLLDNALEAAEDFGEGAYLNLKIQEVHHFRVISIVNASRPGMKKEGHMGVGLENVRRTVEAYQGTMQCEIVGEEYRVSVMLPGKEDS